MMTALQRIKIFFFAFSVFFLLGFVNFISDPANLFHHFEDKMALALVEGNCAFTTAQNLDTRLLKKTLIEKCSKNLDSICIGPSYANALSAEYANSNNYCNFAVPGGDFNDVLATLDFVKNARINFKRIIISLDTNYFDRKILDLNFLSKNYQNYSNEMIDYLYGDKKHELPGTKQNKLEDFFLVIKSLFSTKYFAISVKYLAEYGKNALSRWQIIDNTKGENNYNPDKQSYYFDETGSIIYTTKGNLNRVLRNSAKFDFNTRCTKGAHADKFLTEVFQKLIDDLHSKGKQIEIFITPIPPALYKRLNLSDYPLFTETEEIMQNLKSKYPDIKIFGNYNPEIGGFTNEDFIDERHLKASSYPKLFQTN